MRERGAVDQDAQVELARDVAAFLDVKAPHYPAGRAGLPGDQGLAQHLRGARADVIDRLHHAHAALARAVIREAAGTAAASVDLRLHHPDRAAQLAGGMGGLVWRKGHAAMRYKHVIAPEQPPWPDIRECSRVSLG